MAASQAFQPGPAGGAAGAAQAAIEAMNSGFYNQTDGRWEDSVAWWLTGNALQAVLDYMHRTGSRQYLGQARHTIELQKAPLPWWPSGGGDFRADSTDDTGWWALACVRMFDLTGEAEFLHYAALDEAYMYGFWSDEPCGGGIIWSVPTRTYKNAISNELYMALAAVLHNRTPGDTEYLQRAQASWDWFWASGMVNAQGLVNDGLNNVTNGSCANNGQPTWSYNQGVILGAAAELYRAVGDASYLERASTIADAVVASNSTLQQAGVLTDPCGGPCDNDQAAFKGIFARYLSELGSLMPGKAAAYRAFLVSNAEAAWTGDRNATDFFDVPWQGPFVDASIGSQASAVSLFVALI